jgi:hypothetical protein
LVFKIWYWDLTAVLSFYMVRVRQKKTRRPITSAFNAVV